MFNKGILTITAIYGGQDIKELYERTEQKKRDIKSDKVLC